MTNNMEVVDAQADVRRSRHNRAKARVLAVPILAGLALAACTGGSSTSSPTSKRTAPETSRTAPAPTTTTATTVETAPTPTASASHLPRATGLAGCVPYFDISRYQNHEYEVCTAYITNAAQIALQGMYGLFGFYKFGNNNISYLSSAARQHFETRYWGQPRQAIEREVDAWPKTSNITGNHVEETITLVSLSSSLKDDRGLIQTQESWEVTEPDGTVLHNEPMHTRDITMCRGRLPGHPLHEWVVASNAQIPDFDCIGFDKSHDITP